MAGKQNRSMTMILHSGDGGARKSKLSSTHMGGLGTAMIRKLMRKNNVAPLDELIRDSSDLGVQLVACDMTMGLMGVSKDKLIPEVNEIGGVGGYLDAASGSHVNLFV
jgi:peroxiredoxin family protein